MHSAVTYLIAIDVVKKMFSKWSFSSIYKNLLGPAPTIWDLREMAKTASLRLVIKSQTNKNNRPNN